MFDERNLMYCKYLNLCESSVACVDATYLINLQVLVIMSSDIRVIDLANLLQLEIVIYSISQ